MTRTLAAGFGILVVAVVLPQPANAGARPYGFLQGTDSLPADGLEVETWYGISRPEHGTPSYEWWLGPVAGATDCVELGLFGVFGQTASASSGGGMSLDSLRLQVTVVPVERGKLPLDVRLRAQLGLPMGGEQTTSAWLGVLTSAKAMRVDVTANATGWLAFEHEVEVQNDGTKKSELKIEPYYEGGLGASVRLFRAMRIGGEAFAEGSVSDSEERTLIAGPSFAYGRGRFWASGTWGMGIGDESPAHRGRVVVGIVL